MNMVIYTISVHDQITHNIYISAEIFMFKRQNNCRLMVYLFYYIYIHIHLHTQTHTLTNIINFGEILTLCIKEKCGLEEKGKKKNGQ
uniref:Uncharacterized protein n=1 Tax=Octopus bimaculoides TaxID=37653 RepID=A0A0L8HG59_OCTBM